MKCLLLHDSCLACFDPVFKADLLLGDDLEILVLTCNSFSVLKDKLVNSIFKVHIYKEK